ncbi:MAG: N-acetylmuramoyl-L-alanine amidase [Candidatus Moraniibacteriota bacterium]
MSGNASNRRFSWQGKLALVAFCAFTPPTLPSAAETSSLPLAPEASPLITERLVSVGFRRSAGRNIDSIIIHSCYHKGPGDRYDVESILGMLKKQGVSPHYLIARDGRIYRLVAESNVAYHAGVSRLPDGRRLVNEVSLGIELVNGYDDSYTEAQYASLAMLLRDLTSRYPAISYVLGHREIASPRRTDPWNFEWSRFASFRKTEGRIVLSGGR